MRAPVPASGSRMRERTVESHLRTACREAGLLCLKYTSPARGGVPDRIVVADGKVVFVELKRPGQKPNRRQLETHAKMRRYGADVRVVDSVESVDELVDELSVEGQRPEERSSAA